MNLVQIFKYAKDKKASDVHIMADKPPIIRIDGVLHEIKSESTLNNTAVKKMIFSILKPWQKERFLQQKELDLSYQTPDETRFRVNCFFEKGNMGLVARIIPSVIPTLEDIDAQEIIYKLAMLDNGLILVTGPTGHGKSTTLAAMINLINSEKNANIVTLEDPIEFIFKPKKSIIKQRELGMDMLSFDEGLKHILRQDPNIIMVGEMRDLETIATTITLAETGHLVLATLHTLNASQTIDRIIDIFPPYQQDQIRLQLSMTLRGVISQKLLPKKKGGRIAAREILTNTPAISNMIRENKIAQIKTAIQTSAEEGMITFDSDVVRLYEEGYIDKEVVIRTVSDQDIIKKL